MSVRKEHRVEFASPGTFFSESSCLPIESLDVRKACEMSLGVTERYGAKPFGFRFKTLAVADPVENSFGEPMQVMPQTLWESGWYYLGGEVASYDEVKARDLDDELILRGNMRGNGMWFIVTNRNSWKATLPFNEDDVVVDRDTGEIVERGNAPERMEYRRKMDEQAKQLPLGV